jgi:plasmid stabilization system protein ParE
MKRYKVEVIDDAREDIREARRWYNKRKKGLGKRLTADMAKTIKSITANPRAFAIRYDEYRVANFDTFPYAAHFFVDEEAHRVCVVAIVHTSRHPDTAKDRL